MGKNLEFNWILKLKNSEIPNSSNFRRGEIIEFSNEGERIYPTQMPLFLVNENWDALASGYVRDYHTYEGFVKGNYIIEEILTEEESRVLSGLFRRLYSKKN